LGILSVATATVLVGTMAAALGVPSSGIVGRSLGGTLVLASASGAPGIPVSLRGRIPVDHSTPVELQRHDDSGFRTVAVGKTDGTGKFAFTTYVPDDRATASYRVSSAKVVTPTRAVVTGTTIRLTQDADQTKEPVSRIGAIQGVISGDGQHVAYASWGAVFVWNRAMGNATRVTAEDAPWSSSPSISDDGRFIAYSRNSAAHGRPEVVVWDRWTGVTTQVTRGHTSTSPPSITGNGRYVAYSSRLSELVPHDTNQRSDVFVWDRSSGSNRRITDGNDDSYLHFESFSGAISDTGRYVTFGSSASDLVPGDKNGEADLFVWDRRTTDVRRLPAGDDSAGAAVISGNGRYIAYTSKAGSVGRPLRYLDVFVWDQVTGRTVRLSDDNGNSISPAISTNGRFVVYASHSPTLVPGDTNGRWADVFRWDRRTGTTTMVSDSSLNARVPAGSGNGQHVVYEYGELDGINGPPDIYLWDIGP
jgi:Tol biopolymer transport system component